MPKEFDTYVFQSTNFEPKQKRHLSRFETEVKIIRNNIPLFTSIHPHLCKLVEPPTTPSLIVQNSGEALSAIGKYCTQPKNYA